MAPSWLLSQSLYSPASPQTYLKIMSRPPFKISYHPFNALKFMCTQLFCHFLRFCIEWISWIFNLSSCRMYRPLTRRFINVFIYSRSQFSFRKPFILCQPFLIQALLFNVSWTLVFLALNSLVISLTLKKLQSSLGSISFSN